LPTRCSSILAMQPMIYPAFVYPIDLAGGYAFYLLCKKPAIKLFSFEIFCGFFLK
jgi:hypothetical protein